MYDRELGATVECADCRELVSPEWGTCYEFGDGEFLCFECAKRRGGRFDSSRAGWVIEPDTSQLNQPLREHRPLI